MLSTKNPHILAAKYYPQFRSLEEGSECGSLDSLQNTTSVVCAGAGVRN